MKFTKLTIALLSAATVFVSCNDDDDLGDGRFDRAELYATSNTSGNITVYDFSDDDQTTQTSLTVAGTQNNEGIVYDEDNDQLIFASRTTNSVHVGDNIEDLVTGITSALSVTATNGELASPRSVAVNGNIVVVADNDGDMAGPDGNELYVYVRSGSTLTLRNTLNVNFGLWEIQFNGNDLYAVVDQTNDIAVFNNFAAANTSDGTVTPSKRITIEGIVRTHGLVYNNADDIMILTDIGDAAVDNDGGFHIITNFSNKFGNVANGGTLAVQGNQVRVAGSNTFLGNPISATYDSETNTIFIAERANGGGRILAFDASASGNASPSINNPLAGASSVYFYGED
ncbi:hypothetical protein AAU57_13185 [Nonlabens sp. YIK11]|uniref:hypothetical protein n=1 Tax=Nonlabens sp. YIK11 TaxID=1453349 RepID=UPI0006DCB76D|nr:hypothetical protein [Nonlabens sp. YIK11]KQC34182.1 hypothetical protein AAU57_13185 [Nonlabens sp. YIK11]